MGGVRRRFLGAIATGIGGILAGCSRSESEPAAGGTAGETESGETATAGTDGPAATGTTTGKPGNGGTGTAAWPLLERTPQHHTYAPNASGLGTSFERQWRWSVETAGPAPATFSYSAPVVADGTAYTVVSGSWKDDGERSYVNDLVAVDVEASSKAWSYTYREKGTTRTYPAAVGDGTVVMVDRTGRLHAIDAASGKRAWTRRLSGAAGPPTAVGGVVFVPLLPSGGSGALACYALSDGSPRWSALGRISRFATPAVSGDTVFAPAGPELVALSRSDGAERWRTNAATYSVVTGEAATTPVHSPVVGDDAIYVATGYRAATALDNGVLVSLSPDGGENWRFRPGSPDDRKTVSAVYGVPLLHGGSLYVTGLVRDSSGISELALYAVSADDGALEWKTSIARPNLVTVGAGDAVYVRARDRVTAYATDDGSTVAAADSSAASIAVLRGASVVDDTLLVPSRRGVVAFSATD